MRYRVTALTPLLVGDGDKLSPVDYMVWKDHVNVLDQRRIFKLLARGPRLEGYLTQLKKADKLDFASWGGFAQNFAGRRIPFEHSSAVAHWDRAPRESLFIPTFASSTGGPYLPGSPLKGCLRTAMLFANLRDGLLADLPQRFQSDRPPRRPAEGPEQEVLGASGRSRMRVISTGDSDPIATSAMKVYLVRVSTLQAKGPSQYTLGWKPTPVFAEMALPGTAFDQGARARIFDAANRYATQLIARQKEYAAWTGLELLAQQLTELESKIQSIDRGSACVMCIGWGGGLLAKSAWISPDKDAENYRQILKVLPYYSRAINSGLPFPKTRRIVFQGDKPATLPGWVFLEVA
jgi:CRISPR-associated protein Csm5